MSDATGRLARLLEQELGECCEGAVEDRLAALDDLEEATPLSNTPTDIEVFGALGSETRYRLARLLVAADEELCVCELQPLVSVGSSAVSHALSDLAEVGLVERRQDGRWRYYRATDRAGRLLTTIDETRPAATVGGVADD